jgi:hypothetical protein
LFTGLLVNPSVFRKVGAKKYARAESPDFESDDEDDPAMNVGDGVTTGDSRPAKRQRSGEARDVDEENDPHKMDEEVREEKISIFLSDPEKAVRIFLSSYMREHGLIWYVLFSVIVSYDCLIFFFFLHPVQDGTQPDLYTPPHVFLPCFCSAEPCLPGVRISARLEAGPRDD